jgi:hypothetical protein
LSFVGIADAVSSQRGAAASIRVGEFWRRAKVPVTASVGYDSGQEDGVFVQIVYEKASLAGGEAHVNEETEGVVEAVEGKKGFLQGGFFPEA